MKRRGFNLIELLLSTTIVGLIATTVVANFRANEHFQQLRIAAESLVSDVRKVQAMSLNGTRLTNGTLARGGYGIFFEPSSRRYTLFSEEPFNPDTASPPVLAAVEGRRSPGVFQDISVVSLLPSLILTIPPISGNAFDTMVFPPPRALPCFAVSSTATFGITTKDVSYTVGNPGQLQTETIFDCKGAQPTSIALTLQHADLSRVFTITINRLSGQVTLQ